MKKIHNYIMLLVMAFAVASCADEEIIVNKVVGKPGEEVKFSLSLGEKSRTVYGDETNNTFPIYWVDGDKVQVYSPQALTGRNNAEYKVILPANVEKPNYAEDLVKTGAYGVQWGEGDTYVDDENVEHTGVHDFYSIYPSGNYTFELTGDELTDDELTDKDMIASGVKISSLQEVNYVDGAFVHDMKNCLMYATTPKVDKAGVVNLSYNPLSTVLWFELEADAQSTAQTPKNFMITGIQLESTGTNIAGTFAFNVSDGMFKSWEDGTNKVSLTLFDKSGNQDLSYTLPAGKSINFPIFIAPDSELDLSTMKITVDTDQGTYVKTLSKENTNLTLTPGEIHKVVLPTLNITQKGWDVATWMRYIPRNVYLSEISIPGSWNSLNTDAQGSSPSIETQYANGIRAYHLDTRYKRLSSSSYVLGTADGGSTTNVSGKKVMTSSNNPTFETNLSKITGNVKSDEYMVLICTFAQDSYTPSGTDWINDISEACSINSDVYDAKLLSPNTLVGDVLGKVIVIVNTEGDLTELPEDSKCLFVNMPMTMSASDFSGVLDDRISNIHKAAGTDVAESSISMYHTHAQASIRQDNIPYSGDGDRNGTDRGFMPTRGERKREMENILTWSKDNYGKDNYAHDKWIYLGLGGYYVQWNNGLWGIGAKWEEISNPNTTIAQDFNPWINEKVTAMGTNSVPYYPVGIVLMNYVNDYKDSTVKNILLLNNKYRLQYDASKPTDYKPSGSADSGSQGGGDS